MKAVIAVLFGGKSVEHDISIITGLQVLKNLSKQYSVLPIYIQPNGQWCIAENLDRADTYLHFDKNVKKLRVVTPVLGKPYITIENGGKFKKQIHVYCALLCTHGKNGEDGTLQGVLSMCHIPYTSCGVMSSALCMDKAIAKRLLKSYKIETPAFIDFTAGHYKKSKFQVLEQIESKLPMPVIIKPANLGSSVGIRICTSVENLENCIENALVYDNKVIVETFVQQAREFACAVMKVNGNLICSEIDEAEKEEIFTFENKYIDKKTGKKPKLSATFENKIKKLAMQSYAALDCDGIVRVDFLYDTKNEKLYVNELNTIPGSLAFNLFKVPFRDLLDATILEAVSRQEDSEKFVYEFNSHAIETFMKLSKQNKYAK